MATMFPESASVFTTEGEKVFYNFLSKVARPDSQILAWYEPKISGREPDFILFSPDCGLIVFEVKDFRCWPWRLNTELSGFCGDKKCSGEPWVTGDPSVNLDSARFL